MPKQFRITQRHYDIIIKQARDMLPQESGGFLGGKDGLIQGILPSFNNHLGDRTGTYALTQEDMLRAHEFFKKHGLRYYGVYHTHPNGAPHPSKGDLATNQKYHFIIGMKDPDNPIFNAFECAGQKYTQLPLTIVDMKGMDVKSLHKGVEPTPLDKMADDYAQIDSVISNILQEKENEYQKQDPTNIDSDFSALA